MGEEEEEEEEEEPPLRLKGLRSQLKDRRCLFDELREGQNLSAPDLNLLPAQLPPPSLLARWTCLHGWISQAVAIIYQHSFA
jgi:hypothetical protein